MDEFYGGRIFEVGIVRDRTAFLAAALEPEKLIAVDLHTNRNPGSIAGSTRVGRASTCGSTTESIKPIETRSGDWSPTCSLDLVIDDASHLLTPSTATFNPLFPCPRPGGLHVIEDWSWDLVFRLGIGQRLDELDEVLRRDPGPLAEAGDLGSE